MALKRAVEEAVTYRYYLRSFGCLVDGPTKIYGDNWSALVSTTEPGTALDKKHVALSYHFCREHFSAGIVDICLIGNVPFPLASDRFYQLYQLYTRYPNP